MTRSKGGITPISACISRKGGDVFFGEERKTDRDFSLDSTPPKDDDSVNEREESAQAKNGPPQKAYYKNGFYQGRGHIRWGQPHVPTGRAGKDSLSLRRRKTSKRRCTMGKNLPRKERRILSSNRRNFGVSAPK